MLKIVFLDVGHGDSIIIEWIGEDGKDRIGVIDCNLVQLEKRSPVNPVLNYVIRRGIKVLDFILLTHPHTDHYSGMYHLITEMDKFGFSFKTFFHTSDYNEKFIFSTVSSSDRDYLTLLFNKINALAKKNKIELESVRDRFESISLNKDLELSFLAPTSRQINAYKNYVMDLDLKTMKLKKKNNPRANRLSTITRIGDKKKNWNVLLTSDAPKASFKNIIKKSKLIGELLVIQIPHHGSKKNFELDFYDKTPLRKNTPGCISSGEKYNHPSFEILPSLKAHGLDLMSTSGLNNKNIDDYVSSRSAQSLINEKDGVTDIFNLMDAYPIIFTIPNSGNIIIDIDENGKVKRKFEVVNYEES